MDIVNYLVDIYGYDTPIFLKDVRIGRKSKTAVRELFYRAVKNGDLNRDGPGVYSIVNKSNILCNVVTFEKIISAKFIYKSNVPEGFEPLLIEGYYSGLTFLNMIGMSQQVPAILEVTTNNTSSKKRLYSALGRIAIIRKGRTEITFQNYKILQFLDMFHFVSLDDVKDNKDLLIKYIKKNELTKIQYKEYISLYGYRTAKMISDGELIDAFI